MPPADRAALTAAAVAVALAAPPCVPAPAHAQRPSGTGEVVIGGGYDSHVFLRLSPDVAAQAEPVRGWFAQTAPTLVGALALGGFRLEASWEGDFRRVEGLGWLSYNEGELALSLPELGPARLRLAGQTGRFDVEGSAEERFVFLGGGAALRLQVGEVVRVLTSYRFELRRFSGAGTQDRLHLADLRIPFRPSSRWEIGPHGSFLQIDSDLAPGEPFRRGRGGIEAALVWSSVIVQAAVFGGVAASSAAERYQEIGATTELRVRLGAYVDLLAVGSWTEAFSQPAGSFDRSRRYALVGLAGHATTVRRLDARPAPSALRPVVEGGRARFRLRAPGATSVFVIGSWDDWASPGAALAETKEAGLWEVSVPVGPGAHRYRFVVDGAPKRPPDAARYVSDDFGGEDGVVDVAAAAPAGGSDPE